MRHIHQLSEGNIFFLVMFIGMALWACDPDRIYENNVKIPEGNWLCSDRKCFEVDITDTISLCNIYINIRNNSNYKYMDLWLFVDVFSPVGTVERDTVKIMIADHRGKWMGHGLGDKFDLRMVFRKNVLFPATGKYIFVYEHAMRDEPLTGIDDTGLRIEKASPRSRQPATQRINSL